MHLVLKKLFFLLKRHSEEEKKLIASIKRIVGIKPINLKLYFLATKHSSIARNYKGVKESNDRLEYLGDAIIGAVVAQFLFSKFPFKNEGFLTEIRARIVNRDNLNQLAKKIGLSDIVEYNQNRKHSHSFKSLYGDALEALVGALFLDQGYKACHHFIIKKLLLNHIDLDALVKNNPNYKSRVIEWAHKENKEVKFEILEVKGEKLSTTE